MSRGHRGVILAIGLGLIALWSAFGGAYAVLLLTGDQRRYEYGSSPSTARDPSTPGKFAAYPDLNASACYKAQNHDTADLCAQWRAAIAAEKAAESAREAVFWTIIGTLLSSVGLAALIVTIRQGREGLEIAQTIGRAQTRAYLDILSIEGRVNEAGLVFRTTVGNSGQSPALSAQIMLKVIGGEYEGIRILPDIEHQIAAQSSSELAYCYFPNKAAKGWETIVVSATVAYADVFGGLDETVTIFTGMPNRWTDDFTEMMKGVHITSYLRAMHGDGSTDDSKDIHA